MGEPEQWSPPVWPSFQRVNNGKARATFTRYVKYVQSPQRSPQDFIQDEIWSKSKNEGCRGCLQNDGCRVKVAEWRLQEWWLQEWQLQQCCCRGGDGCRGGGGRRGGGVGHWWCQGWSSAPQVSYGPGEGCLDEPGPETRGAHQGQRVGDGGHGLTELEPEPKRAMVRRQRRLCPERWAAAVVGLAVVGWQWWHGGVGAVHPRSVWTRWGVCGRKRNGMKFRGKNCFTKQQQNNQMICLYIKSRLFWQYF